MDELENFKAAYLSEKKAREAEHELYLTAHRENMRAANMIADMRSRAEAAERDLNKAAYDRDKARQERDAAESSLSKLSERVKEVEKERDDWKAGSEVEAREADRLRERVKEDREAYHRQLAGALDERDDLQSRLTALEAWAKEARDILSHAREWVSSVPHGDNCFVSNHSEFDPGNQCNCGKDSTVGFLDEVLESTPDGKEKP